MKFPKKIQQAQDHIDKGIELAKKELYQDAIREFNESLKIYENATPHENLASVYIHMGLFDQAIKEAKIALKSAPRSAGTHNNLGFALANSGRIEEAIIECEKAVHLDPSMAELHDSLGFAYTKNRQYDIAIEEFNKAIQLKPELAESHNVLGYIYFNTGKIDEAVKEYKEAIRIKPDYAEAHINLGQALSKKSQDYTTLLKKNPVFKQVNFPIEKDLCFILMPYKESEFSQLIYKDYIYPAVTNENFRCVRADDISHTRIITDVIWEYINKAYVLVAEITNKNPNVIYELGLAHALGKDVIILSQTIQNLPFDVKHIRVIQYENSHEGLKKMKKELSKTLIEIKK